MDAQTTDANVSLYLWDPKLSQQTNHWHVVKIIP